MLKRPMRLLMLLALPLAVWAENPLDLGTISTVAGHHPYILSAPHGGFDLQTDVITADVARALDWSAVIATDFRSREHPYNVNRPSEGIGLSSDREPRTENAKVVYEAFRLQILKIDRNPELYTEIHGEAAPGLEARIEVATVGITLEQAQKVRAILQKNIAALSPENAYTVAVEGVDKIKYMASASKKFGTLHEFKRALHIELPKKLRVQETEKAEMFLKNSLPELVEVLGKTI